MRLVKKVMLCMVTGLGVLLLFGVFQSQAQNVGGEASSSRYTRAFWFWVGQPQAVNITHLQGEYGKAQEEMGRAIKESAWLEYNRGKVQETLGRFIQEGGPEGNVLQEELGSGIAAAAHIRWRTIGVQEAIADSILSVSDVVAQEAQIVTGENQEGLGQMILEVAQEDYATAQETLGRQVLRQAQLDYAGGIMATTLQASIRGEDAGPISQELVSVVRRNTGYNQLSNFALAASMLEGETGISLSHIFPSESPAADSGTYAAIDQGWGGFAEFGFFSIAGFVFLMWAAGWVVKNAGSPLEGKEEEEFVEYQEAA